MYKVDIYLAQSTASLSKDERWHGYVVACIKNGEEKTVNGFGHIFGTYHEATLRSLSDALDRLNQSCEVHIHTEDRFVLNMLGAQLENCCCCFHNRFVVIIMDIWSMAVNAAAIDTSNGAMSFSICLPLSIQAELWRLSALPELWLILPVRLPHNFLCNFLFFSVLICTGLLLSFLLSSPFSHLHIFFMTT